MAIQRNTEMAMERNTEMAIERNTKMAVILFLSCGGLSVSDL